jgi:hypothetical protein
VVLVESATFLTRRAIGDRIMTFVTTSTEHERMRYAEYFDSLAESAHRVAEAVRTGSDQAALTDLLEIAMTNKPLWELLDVFKNAINAKVSDDPSALDKPGK